MNNDTNFADYVDDKFKGRIQNESTVTLTHKSNTPYSLYLSEPEQVDRRIIVDKNKYKTGHGHHLLNVKKALQTLQNFNKPDNTNNFWSPYFCKRGVESLFMYKIRIK